MCSEHLFKRQATRAAIRIHEHLRSPSCQAANVALPQRGWDDVAALLGRFHLIQARGWQAARGLIVSDLEYQLRRLAAELDSLRTRLPQPSAPEKVSSAGTIAADLLALEGDFEAVVIDLKEKVLRVDTAGIVLEDIHLGAFQIVLHWERIGAGRAYDVRALEPNCPVGRGDVTHPHVEDHQLCEGAGASAIRTALAGGRLLDFFLLVRQILETYNGGSAYVSLSDWSGSEDVTCADCGCFTSSEDCGCCERCDDRVCSDCQSTCGSCSRYVCCDCCGLCADCSHSFCQTCLNEVADSQRLLCDSCLEKKEDSDDVQDDREAATADAVCLGETAVPA
jgi:hypothetical protein